MTIIEAVADNIIAFGLSLFVTMYVWSFIFGVEANLAQGTGSVLIFSAMSIVRRYIVRRGFEWLKHDRGIN